MSGLILPVIPRIKSHWLMLLTIVFPLLLSSCMPSEDLTTPEFATEPNFVTNTGTTTVIPSSTITPTQVLSTATATPSSATSLPTPALPDWMAHDFLFANQLPGCELPCWQGLTPGQSTVHQVQTAFDLVLGRMGAGSFVRDSSRASEIMTPYLGLYDSYYGWYLSVEPQEGFGIDVWTEQGTDILQGLYFRWAFQSLSDLDTNMSPERIIKTLGPPRYILASITSLEVSDQGYLRLLMIYERGIFVSHDLIVPITFPDNRPNNPTAELCIGARRRS